MLGWIFSNILWIILYATFSMAHGSSLIYRNWADLHSPSNNDRGFDEFTYLVGAVLWPVAWTVLLAVAICTMTYRAMRFTAMKVGTRKNIAHIRQSEIQMREQDLERMGGSLELALRYNYVTCMRCLGRGCRDCSDRGVQRVHGG